MPRKGREGCMTRDGIYHYLKGTFQVRRKYKKKSSVVNTAIDKSKNVNKTYNECKATHIIAAQSLKPRPSGTNTSETFPSRKPIPSGLPWM
ncbi:hypothetical protein Avbf_07993 [Armadillidium vulgare]|nr:hypothetical protein Avbf_12817 [Armadillidium vulgare]RXG68134.1 hypothetical protein Avbf_07993 [Armadillidium vulgare]